VEFRAVNLSCDANDAPHQFDGRLRLGGNDFRVRFGSGGGGVCHLWCDGDHCSPTVCLP
jgi:hypothetical protein